MSNGHMWVIAISGILIFLALATVASSFTGLIKIFRSKPSPPEKELLVGFKGDHYSFARLFVDPYSVTQVERLTGEGGTRIKFAGGTEVGVNDEIDEVVSRLRGKSMPTSPQ